MHRKPSQALKYQKHYCSKACQDLSQNLQSPICPIHWVPKVKALPRGWRCNLCNNDKRADWYKADPRTIMLVSARVRAKRDGVPFNLVKEDIVIPEYCPILGLRIQAGTRKEHDNSATVDRIIPHLGYVKTNIVVISHKANRIKSNATLQELKAIVNYLEGRIGAGEESNPSCELIVN